MFRNARTHQSEVFQTAGEMKTLQIPTNGKITSLLLRFYDATGAALTEAQIRAQVGYIRLTINGQNVINALASEILDAYEFLGVKVGNNGGVNGALELNFGSLVYTDPVLGEMTGWGTQDVSTIQVQIIATAVTDLRGVQAYTERLPIDEPLGQHIRFLEYPQSFTTTGEITLDTLPRDSDSGYLAIMIKPETTGVISTGEMGLNNNVLMEQRPSIVNALSLSNKGLIQPSGYYVYNAVDGLLSGIIPMAGVQDFRLKTTFTTADTKGYKALALTLNKIPVA